MVVVLSLLELSSSHTERLDSTAALAPPSFPCAVYALHPHDTLPSPDFLDR
jgi:hypothetical protein